MSEKKVLGKCHICGNVGKLSFEHIPPERAFNNRPSVKATFENVIGLGPDGIIKGPIQQRGVGDYTLCPKCNNDTGSWYGESFIDWCYQGFEILKKSNGNPSLIYLNYLFPLRIIKQIITMFFSVNNPEFGDAHPELVKFVKNKYYKYLSPRYRIFVYYNISGMIRSSGVSASVDMDTANIKVLSEFSFPPYGYVLTFDSKSPDPRLIEITHFSKYGYNEYAVQAIRFPVLPTYLFYPGDYRTKEEILKDRLKNEEYLKKHKEIEGDDIK